MTFFYSSNGEKSIGGYDVFYNQKGTDKNWSSSINIGTPINTVNDEYRMKILNACFKISELLKDIKFVRVFLKLSS